MLYRDGYLDWETEHPTRITLGDMFSDSRASYYRAHAAVKRQRDALRAMSRSAAGASAVYVSGWVPRLDSAFAEDWVEEPPILVAWHHILDNTLDGVWHMLPHFASTQ